MSVPTTNHKSSELLFMLLGFCFQISHVKPAVGKDFNRDDLQSCHDSGLTEDNVNAHQTTEV